MHIIFLTILGFQPIHEIWEKLLRDAVVRTYAKNIHVLQQCQY